MSLDRSNPLLEFNTKERLINIPELGMSWSVFTQTEDLEENVSSRQFSEFEFTEGIKLELGISGPDSHPDRNSYSFHYRLKSEFYIHQYQGQKNWVELEQGAIVPPELTQLNSYGNFVGWAHDTQVFNKTDYWTDDLAFVVVWQLFSRTNESTPAVDKVYTFNPSGVITNTQTLNEPGSIEINAEKSWGLRTEASHTSFQFQMLDTNSTVINNWTRTGSCSVPTPPAVGGTIAVPTLPVCSVDNNAPNLLTNERVKVLSSISTRPVLTVDVTDPQTMIVTTVVVPQVIEEVRLFFYGQYWINDLEFVNVYSQGYLTHPAGTSENLRMKPPGKSGLSDVPNQVVESLTPNASRSSGSGASSGSSGSSGGNAGGGTSGGSSSSGGNSLSSQGIEFTQASLSIASVLPITLGTGIKGAGVTIFDQNGQEIDPDQVLRYPSGIGVNLTSYVPIIGTWTAYVGD